MLNILKKKLNSFQYCVGGAFGGVIWNIFSEMYVLIRNAVCA